MKTWEKVSIGVGLGLTGLIGGSMLMNNQTTIEGRIVHSNTPGCVTQSVDSLGTPYYDMNCRLSLADLISNSTCVERTQRATTGGV